MPDLGPLRSWRAQRFPPAMQGPDDWRASTAVTMTGCPHPGFVDPTAGTAAASALAPLLSAPGTIFPSFRSVTVGPGGGLRDRPNNRESVARSGPLSPPPPPPRRPPPPPKRGGGGSGGGPEGACGTQFRPANRKTGAPHPPGRAQRPKGRPDSTAPLHRHRGGCANEHRGSFIATLHATPCCNPGWTPLGALRIGPLPSGPGRGSQSTAPAVTGPGPRFRQAHRVRKGAERVVVSSVGPVVPAGPSGCCPWLSGQCGNVPVDHPPPPLWAPRTRTSRCPNTYQGHLPTQSPTSKPGCSWPPPGPARTPGGRPTECPPPPPSRGPAARWVVASCQPPMGALSVMGVGGPDRKMRRYRLEWFGSQRRQ